MRAKTQSCEDLIRDRGEEASGVAWGGLVGEEFGRDYR